VKRESPRVRIEHLISEEIVTMAYARNAKALYCGSPDGNIRVFTDEFCRMARFNIPSRQIFCVAHCAAIDGREILAVGCDEGRIVVLETPAMGAVWDHERGWEDITALSFCPHGRLLCAGSDAGGVVTVMDALTGSPLRTFRGHTSRISSLVFSRDGEKIFSASKDRSVRVWLVFAKRESKIRSFCSALEFGEHDTLHRVIATVRRWFKDVKEEDDENAVQAITLQAQRLTFAHQYEFF
jgi:WD40 repeat protein